MDARGSTRSRCLRACVGEGSRQIFGDAVAGGRRQGATSVGVDTAAPAVHLVQLYTAWGFAQVDTIRWPDKVYDSVVMTRLLSADDA